jgi:hypothetical protein
MPKDTAENIVLLKTPHFAIEVSGYTMLNSLKCFLLSELSDLGKEVRWQADLINCSNKYTGLPILAEESAEEFVVLRVNKWKRLKCLHQIWFCIDCKIASLNLHIHLVILPLFTKSARAAS